MYSLFQMVQIHEVNLEVVEGEIHSSIRMVAIYKTQTILMKIFIHKDHEVVAVLTEVVIEEVNVAVAIVQTIGTISKFCMMEILIIHCRQIQSKGPMMYPIQAVEVVMVLLLPQVVFIVTTVGKRKNNNGTSETGMVKH